MVKTDWLGRPIKRTPKAYGKKAPHPPRAKGTTTRSRRKKTTTTRKAKK